MMFPLERQEKLLQYINKKKKANVQELSRMFKVSAVTIRRDLDELASKGLVVKTHGGVLSAMNNLSMEIPSAVKFDANSEAKRSIGAAAAAMIDDGDIIILDAGSTTLEVLRHMQRQNVTVLTNDIKIAMETAHKPNVRLLVSGGEMLDGSVYTLVGSQTAEFFRRVHVNKTFLGCDAIDIGFGVSNRTMEEVEVKRAMIAAADEVIMVTDSSKLNKKVFCFLCEVSAIQKLVINEIDDVFRQELEKRGVEVIVSG